MSPRLRFGLMLGLQALFLVFIAATYRDYGVSWDEYFYLDTARLYLAHFFDMARIGEGERVALHLKTHGALMDALVWLPLRMFDAVGSYEALHLVKALLSSAVPLLVYRILCRLEPGSGVPLAGMAILMLFPPWLGQIFDDHTDGSATLLFALLIAIALPLLDAERALDGPARRAAGRAIALGLLSGAAFSHRVPLLVVPAAALAVLGVQGRSRRRLRRWLALSGLFAAVFWVTLFAVDPWVRLHPLTGPFERIAFAASPAVVSRLRVLFDGRLFEAADLPRSYLLHWMAISIPLVTLAFTGLGLVRLAGWLRPAAGPQRRGQAAFLLLVLGAPLAAAAALHAVVFDAWRHFLFLAVPIALIASLGLGLAAERGPRGLGPAAAAILLLGLAPVAHAVVRLHPYSYIYLNELVGGVAGGAGRYENDYWGKSYKEAAAWLRSRVAAEPGTRFTVYVCGPEWAAAYYFPEKLSLAPDLASADYAICFTRAGSTFRAPRRPPDHVVEREGVALARIWRGTPPIPLRPPP